MRPQLRFPTVKTAGLYLVTIETRSKNTHDHLFLKWTLAVSKVTITFHHIDIISNTAYSKDSVSSALQNCTFQLSSYYAFDKNNVNLQRGIETFRPTFMNVDWQINYDDTSI